MPRGVYERKPKQQPNGDDRQQIRGDSYGEHIIIQVPIGKHQTRSVTLDQARVMYRHLRKFFK